MISRRFVVLLMVSALCFTQLWATEGENGVNWHKNLDRAIELAKEKSAPLLIRFWTELSDPLRKVDSNSWANKQLITLSKKFVCVSVKVAHSKGKLASYRIKNLPTTVIFDSGQNELVRFINFTKAEDLIEAMMLVPGDYSEVKDSLPIIKKDKKNLKALMDIAYFYATNRSPGLSNEYFSRALKTKEAKKDPELKGQITFSLGANHLKMGNFKKALKIFNKASNKLKDTKYTEMILLGLLQTQLKLGKIKQAQATYKRIQSQFPNSKTLQVAAAAMKRAGENVGSSR